MSFVELRREQSQWIVNGAFLAKALLGLAVVVAASLAMVAIETAVLAANGLLADSDLLLSLAQ
jgi:hypothetical protein